MLVHPHRLRRALVKTETLAGHQADEVRMVRAPGRVNLIGEHTDYNEGFVLPAAIGLETWIASAPSNDRRVELTRLDSGERDGFQLDGLAPPPEGSERWIDYVAGVAWSLAREGVRLRGVRGVIASDLPISSGLSSSAALELASAWTLCAEAPPPLDGMRLAQACQRAENEYVGVKVGLMDQFASALGRPSAALLLDCRSLEYRAVELPLDDYLLVVCDTRSPRRLESSQYNARRAQCERGVAVLARQRPEIRSLRDVSIGLLESAREELDEETFRRCEHVVRENDRVLAFERALGDRDLAAAGRLMAESHVSLRDLYEVSSPELDALVAICSSVEGVVGARMTGAGFGGCTVNLAARDAVDRVREAVAREYPSRSGLEAAVYVVEPVGGAGLVEP